MFCNCADTAIVSCDSICCCYFELVTALFLITTNYCIFKYSGFADEFEEKMGSTGMFYEKWWCFALRRCQFFWDLSKKGTDTRSWLDDLLRMEIVEKVTAILCLSGSWEAQLLQNQTSPSLWVTACCAAFQSMVGFTSSVFTGTLGCRLISHWQLSGLECGLSFDESLGQCTPKLLSQ